MATIVDHLLEGVQLPKFVRIRQQFPSDHIAPEQIREVVCRQLNQPRIAQTIQPGMSVCITCGSRGIDNIVAITRSVVQFCQERGAKPFAIPAMGSHGGATDQGQLEVLQSFGITEETLGCPIRSSMQTALIGTTEDGRPVYIDHYAAAADTIILINRIKPHTSFRGTYESGLMKMMSIGLAKQKGAETCHAEGFPRMHHMVPLFGRAILQQAPIAFGLGILENAFDQTAQLHALTPSEIIDKEPVLLKEAAKLMPSLGFTDCDVLVVDEIGKTSAVAVWTPIFPASLPRPV